MLFRTRTLSCGQKHINTIASLILLCACFNLWIWFHSRVDKQSNPSNTPVQEPTGKGSSPNLQAHFPRKIWQTWRSKLSTLPAQNQEAVDTWQDLNTNYRYEMLTDSSAETYVIDTFSSSNPDIVETYSSLPSPIMKADYLRYLLLYAEGGVYSDIDTKALRPIDEWVSFEYQQRVGLILGIDTDEPDKLPEFGPYHFALCQSTMMSQPGHQALGILIENIAQSLPDIQRASSTGLSDFDVLKTTGPLALTLAVMQYLRRELGEGFSEKNITGLHQMTFFRDILILPPSAFMAGSGDSNSGSVEDPAALVQHFFQGSWRTGGAAKAS